MANTTANNVLAPIVIYHEFTVLGCANTSGNSFVIAPSADVTDSLGLANNRWGNVYSYGINLGNTTINSYGNSTVNSASANGYTILPGGLIFQWGSAIANSTGNTVTFPIPFVSNVFSFHVTGSQANVTTATANTTKGVVSASAGTPTYFWMAVGM